MKYAEVAITRAHGGFGEWQTGEAGDKWEFDSDLIAEIAGDVDEILELGKDNLPDEVEDIRGRIHDQPQRVFAVRQGDEWRYIGIVEAAK